MQCIPCPTVDMATVVLGPSFAACFVGPCVVCAKVALSLDVVTSFTVRFLEITLEVVVSSIVFAVLVLPSSFAVCLAFDVFVVVATENEMYVANE